MTSLFILLSVKLALVHSLRLNLNSLCEDVQKNSFVPDPKDCTKFLQCNGDSVIRGSCPDGMYYHSKNVCSNDDSQCPLASLPVSPSTDHPGTTNVVITTENSMTITPSMGNSLDPKSFCSKADPNIPIFLRSPSVCSEYYICVNKKPVLQKCVTGTYWNPVELFCDDPKHVPCEHDRIIDPIEFCQKNEAEISFTASSDDCGTYYICIQHNPFLMHCAKGSHWNNHTKQCDDPSVANCRITFQSPKNFDSLCSESGRMFLSHPKYCDLYLFCQNGIASAQRCPFFNDWDPTTESCLPRYANKCSKERFY